MIQHIVIPLDGSVLAEQALTPGLTIARATNANVLLLRAVRQVTPHLLDPSTLDRLRQLKTLEQLVTDAGSYLEAIAKARATEGVNIDTVVIEGDAATAIVDAAAHEVSDLIVMSTHGATGLQRLMYGSVTEKVLRHAPCALLAVRSAEIPTNMLIPLDGSPLSEAILPIAVGVAASFGAQLTLTRVQDPHDAPNRGELEPLRVLDRELFNQLQNDYDRQSWHYLERLISEKLANTGLKASYDIDRGHAAERILAVAIRNECDMIAMSTHGRTGVQRWRYGSVTERVLRSANMPILITRPDDAYFTATEKAAAEPMAVPA